MVLLLNQLNYGTDYTTGQKKLYYPKIGLYLNSLPCDQIWHDYLLIYGVWDKLPSWKELRKHYDRTWWFHKTIQDKRDITINKLING